MIYIMQKQKKKPSSGQRIVRELQEIRATIENIETQIEELKPKKGARKAWQLLAQGMIKGVAFAFGTTVLAGLILLGVYQILNSESVQGWINNTMQTTLENTVGGAVSEAFGNVMEN